jgi:hypothetical protein
MKPNRTHKSLIAVAVVVVIVGITIAIVSGGGHKHSNTAPRTGRVGTVAVAAGYLGISRSQLRSDLADGQTLAEIANSTSGKSAAGLVHALVQARAKRIEARAASGKLSKSEAAARLVAARKAASTASTRRSAAGRKLAVTATYLGVPATHVLEQQRAGHSLAQIADQTSGKSAAGLIGALTRSRKAVIAAAVHAGTISAAQAGTLLAGLTRRTTAEVQRVPPKRQG